MALGESGQETAAVSRIKANQLICTGSCLVLLSGGVLVIGHVLGHGQHRFLGDLEICYWASCATFLNGIIAILGGIKKTTTAVVLYIAFCILSCGVEIALGIVSTKLLNKWRRKMDCPPATCPYDEVSILILSLICVAALSALMSLAGVLEIAYAFLLEDDRLATQDKQSLCSTKLSSQRKSEFSMCSYPCSSTTDAEIDQSCESNNLRDGKCLNQNKFRYAEIAV